MVFLPPVFVVLLGLVVIALPATPHRGAFASAKQGLDCAIIEHWEPVAVVLMDS